MSARDWSKPMPITALESAFGPARIDDRMPRYEDVPAEFKRAGNQWEKEASSWFFAGVPADTPIEAADGIDLNIALRHLGCVLASFEPKHEHKMAGAAYLMSLWFVRFGNARRAKVPA